jgi:hypothetical protein
MKIFLLQIFYDTDSGDVKDRPFYLELRLNAGGSRQDSQYRWDNTSCYRLYVYELIGGWYILSYLIAQTPSPREAQSLRI